MKLEERLISTEYIFKGSVITLRRDKVMLPDNQEATREVVEHPGGVCVLAINDNDEVLMVKQYRRPLDAVTYEIPAGKLTYGENHLHCGMRELEEETGYKAKNFEYLGGFYLTPGFCNEIIHIYLATGLYKGTMNPDEDEFLKPSAEPFSSLLSRVLKGEITDCKTALAISLAALKRLKIS